jgi:hypothetical protein
VRQRYCRAYSAGPLQRCETGPEIAMGEPKKQARGSELAKVAKGRQAQAKANKNLAGQIRKILGKHYASKYRVQSREGH